MENSGDVTFIFFLLGDRLVASADCDRLVICYCSCKSYNSGSTDE